jgi:hypothetical protein
VIGVGSVLLQMVGSSTSGGPSGASTVRPSDARNAFSSRSLEGQVSTLLRKHPDPAQTQKESGSTTPTPSLDMGSKDSTGSVGAPKTATPLERPDIAMDVPDCVLRGIGRNEAPIVAERGTFDGTDAFLVVFPHATDQSKVSAYVVDATCAEKPLAPAGTILLTHAYPRR